MSKQLLEILNKHPFSIVSAGLVVDEVDGTITFLKSGEFYYLTPSFVNSYGGATIEKTKRIHTIGAELKVPATFKEMFDPLSSDLRKIAFTEHQIVNFIRRNRTWMNAGGTVYFPFKYKGHVCVAAVFANSKKTSFGVDVYTFDNETKWGPIYGTRIVVPWLAQ